MPFSLQVFLQGIELTLLAQGSAAQHCVLVLVLALSGVQKGHWANVLAGETWSPLLPTRDLNRWSQLPEIRAN